MTGCSPSVGSAGDGETATGSLDDGKCHQAALAASADRVVNLNMTIRLPLLWRT